MKKLASKIQALIENLETVDQRFAAEGIADLLIEGVISEREAKRQLKVNGIEI
jgi:hypothetical protein